MTSGWMRASDGWPSALGSAPGIDVDYQSSFDGRLADETETHLFRIVQEALTNVARHSGATRVVIELERRAGNRVHLTVKDNGHGFSGQRRFRFGIGWYAGACGKRGRRASNQLQVMAWLWTFGRPHLASEQGATN